MKMTQWSSDDTWNKGGKRTITKEGPDPEDKRFVAKQLEAPLEYRGRHGRI